MTTLSNITVDATNCTRLTTVNNCAVYDRTGITVQLPETVTTIGEDAFAGGSQNSVSCENPNIVFSGADHTGTDFQFTGPTRSIVYERYNTSGKFASQNDCYRVKTIFQNSHTNIKGSKQFTCQKGAFVVT